MSEDHKPGNPLVRPTVGPMPPPHPLDKQWFVHTNGEVFGPYTGHQIRQMKEEGRLSEADHVCPLGANAWIRVSDDPVLGGLFAQRQNAPTHGPTSGPIHAKGGTVVQVTNVIPAPYLDDGFGGPKSPGVALLLSLLLCGAGQMYNGQVGKGIAFLIGYILAWFVLLFWIVWIWSMVDAYVTAKNMNLRYQRQMLAGSR